MKILTNARQFDILIDTEKCKGDGCCVRICPHSVLSIKRFQTNKSRRSLLSQIKSVFLSNEKSYVEDYASCSACGRCEKICPEGAIKIEFLRA